MEHRVPFLLAVNRLDNELSLRHHIKLEILQHFSNNSYRGVLPVFEPLEKLDLNLKFKHNYVELQKLP